MFMEDSSGYLSEVCSFSHQRLYAIWLLDNIAWESDAHILCIGIWLTTVETECSTR